MAAKTWASAEEAEEEADVLWPHVEEHLDETNGRDFRFFFNGGAAVPPGTFAMLFRRALAARGDHPNWGPLKNVNGSYVSLLNEGAVAFAKEIVRGGDQVQVEEIQLESSAIGDAGAAELGRALAGQETVERLFLQNNAIGASGAVELVTHLQMNDTLKTLDLNNNRITNGPDALSIPEALQGQPSLNFVNLNNNVGLDDGVVAKVRSVLYENVQSRKMRGKTVKSASKR
jgi:hypothetical protein